MKNTATTIQAVPEMQRFLQKQKPKTRIRTKQPVDFSLEKYITPRIRTKQLAEFTRQLATLLEARLSLTRALEILTEQSTHQKLRKILEDILAKIRGGQSFSNCLKSQPRVFSEFFCKFSRGWRTRRDFRANAEPPGQLFGKAGSFAKKSPHGLDLSFCDSFSGHGRRDFFTGGRGADICRYV